MNANCAELTYSKNKQTQLPRSLFSYITLHLKIFVNKLKVNLLVASNLINRLTRLSWLMMKNLNFFQPSIQKSLLCLLTVLQQRHITQMMPINLIIVLAKLSLRKLKSVNIKHSKKTVCLLNK